MGKQFLSQECYYAINKFCTPAWDYASLNFFLPYIIVILSVIDITFVSNKLQCQVDYQ
jgi:hypothetical protein